MANNPSQAQSSVLKTMDTTEPIPKNLKPTAQKYIPIEDILAYRAKGLSTTDIGRIVGCSSQNVQNRLKRLDLENLENFRQHKDAVFEHTQRKIVKSLDADKLKGMSGLQLITGAAILEDKIRTIRGESTAIIDHRTITASLDEITARMRDVGILNTNGNDGE